MTAGDHAGPRPGDSTRAVFEVLAGAGRATRPQLAAACGLSKPTVSLAVAELEAAGLAARAGTANGATGRSAAVYRLGPRAGCVLAVDLGSTHTEGRGCALDGAVLAVQGTDNELRPADAVHTVIDALRAAAAGPLRAVVVAVPDVAGQDADGLVRPATARIRGAVEALALPAGVPVGIENNVNCAALAELHEGAARDRDRAGFGYLQIGYGIGLGIVLGGQMLRGANGAAGEVARLPYPWAAAQQPRHEGLEAYAGARSLIARAAVAWRPDEGDGPVPHTAEELFSLAARGHATAAALVAGHAAEVGRLAAAVVAVLDPGLIVLGGGIGANPQLLPGVRAELARLSWPTEVVSSVLGNSGTVLGATRLAVARGIQNVTGEETAGH
jgi:predicted NBD/HSP70 family sugar kinase